MLAQIIVITSMMTPSAAEPAEIEALEGGLPAEDRQRLGGPAGPALGHDIDQLEGVDRVDDPEEQRHAPSRP